MKRLARPWVSWTTLGMLTVATGTATPRPVSGTDGPTPAPTPAVTAPAPATPSEAADSTPLPLDLDSLPLPDDAVAAPEPAPASTPAVTPAPASAPVAAPTKALADEVQKPLAPVAGPTALKPVPAAQKPVPTVPGNTVILPREAASGPSPTPAATQGVQVPEPIEIVEPAKTPVAATPTTGGNRSPLRPSLPLLQPTQLTPSSQFAGELQVVADQGTKSPSGTTAAPTTATRPTETSTTASTPATVPALPLPAPESAPAPIDINAESGKGTVARSRASGKGTPSIPVTSTIPLASEPKLVPPANAADQVPAKATDSPSAARPVPVLKAPSIVTGDDAPRQTEASAPATGAEKVAAGAEGNAAGSPTLSGAAPTLTAPTLTPPVPSTPAPSTPDKPATAEKSGQAVETAPKPSEGSKDSSGAASGVREPKNVPAVPEASPSAPSEKPTGDAPKPKPAEVAPEKPRDPLLTLVDQAIDVTSQRQLRIGMNSPWQIVHGVVALRWDMKIQTQDGKGHVSAIEYLMGGNTFENQPIWQETAWGGRGHPYTRPYAHEGHPTQFLGYMTMANIPLDYEIKTPTKIITVRDVINDAKMQVRQGPEITWTLWALAHYEESDAQWRNNAGEPWSIERLVKLQVDERVTNSACGGCHGMFALCYARNLYFTTGRPLTGVWLEADQKIKWYTEATRRMQNTDGSLSSNFYKGPGYSNDYDTRLNTTGHQLEWILVSLPQSRLGEPWVRRAVEALSRDLITNARFPAECGPMYHSLHALILYRQRLDPKFRVPKRNSSMKLAERELTRNPTAAAPAPNTLR